MHIKSLILPLFLALTTSAELIPAPEPRYLSTTSLAPGFSKRQSCPYTCSAVDGDTMCMQSTDVCCQRIATNGSGTYPFVCPKSHPYCCPADSSGNPQCGNTSSCKNSGSSSAAGLGRRVDGMVVGVAVLGGLAMV
ncbi:hypothetical protein FB567DRAFT_536808 [Paraphoma chrysanthemicola]|uniref:Uncharacterized protein n=1 Tax=Paraphoma chrysanthemicola TaxID=798071 RepID=A0A8K0QW72_9PLEO|nr:hypothetical protein FB567DRAFT_536808 [Paraphoma chrysanthemicola]